MQDYASLSDSLALIRSSSPEELRDPSFLENRVLPDLGAALEGLEARGEESSAPSGPSESSWACPGELARFLVYLSGQGIRSYLEIGCHSGTTAILITEYLSRFETLGRVAFTEVGNISPQLLEYREHREFDYLQGVSSVALLAPQAEGEWDLVLIDGSRGFDRVRSDFMDIADEAKMVAVQDIAAGAPADLSRFWAEVKALADPADVHEFMTDSTDVTGSRCRIGVVSSPGSVRLPFWSASSQSPSSWQLGAVADSQPVPAVQQESRTPVLAFPQAPEPEELDELKLRNYARYVVTMREGRAEAWNTPLVLYLESSDRCNYRCVFCCPRGLEGVSMDTDIMPAELMEGIAPFLSGLGTLFLHGAGEPLLNPHLVDATIAGLAHKVGVTFYTNGSLLTPEWVSRLVAAGLPQMTVSISTADPDLYARLYKGGRLSKLEANLMNLKEEKRRQNRVLPRLLFNAVAMQSSFPGLPDLVRFGAKVGAGNISLTPLVVHPGLESEDMSYKPERDDPIIAEAQAVAAESGIGLFLDPFLRTKGEPESCDCAAAPPVPAEPSSTQTPQDLAEHGMRFDKPCSQVFSTMLVRVNGDVMPCCRATGDTASLGNATTQSLEEIWNGPEYQRLRAQHVALEVPPMCAHCFTEGQLRERHFAPCDDEAVAWLMATGIELVDYEKFSAAMEHVQAAFAELDRLVSNYGGGPTGDGGSALSALLSALSPIADRITSSKSEALQIGGSWPALEVTLSSIGDLTEELSGVLQRARTLKDAEQEEIALDLLLAVVSDLALRGGRIVDVATRAFNRVLDQMSLDSNQLSWETTHPSEGPTPFTQGARIGAAHAARQGAPR